MDLSVVQGKSAPPASWNATSVLLGIHPICMCILSILGIMSHCSSGSPSPTEQVHLLERTPLQPGASIRSCWPRPYFPSPTPDQMYM
jgi:hypothetical protein